MDGPHISGYGLDFQDRGEPVRTTHVEGAGEASRTLSASRPDDEGDPMIIYGWKTYVQVLAVLHMVCSQCGNNAEHVLRKLTTKFTLFWIPLFPINKKHTTFCTACENEQKIPGAQAQQLVASGGMGMQAPGMPGPGMPPPGMPAMAGPGMPGPGMPQGMPGPGMAPGTPPPGMPAMAGPGMPPGTPPQGMPGPGMGPGTPPPGMPHPGMGYGMPGPGMPPQGPPPPGYGPQGPRPGMGMPHGQPPYPPQGYSPPPGHYGPR